MKILIGAIVAFLGAKSPVLPGALLQCAFPDLITSIHGVSGLFWRRLPGGGGRAKALWSGVFLLVALMIKPGSIPPLPVRDGAMNTELKPLRTFQHSRASAWRAMRRWARTTMC